MGKTKFAYPVAKICGKISRHSDVIHRCVPSGGDITYLQGERNLELHPVTPDETANQSAFGTLAKQVGARLKKTASTYAADMAAYREQLKGENPIEGFQKYIWHLVKE